MSRGIEVDELVVADRHVVAAVASEGRWMNAPFPDPTEELSQKIQAVVLVRPG
jgi:hypothetical protein